MDSFIDNVNLIELEERIQTTIEIKQINTHNIITIDREGYSQNYLPNTSENTYKFITSQFSWSITTFYKYGKYFMGSKK